MEPLNKKKYDFLLYLFEEGDAMVCLDARLSEVDVPASHKNNSSLNLIFNLNFKRPFEIKEEGIFASLVFNGRPYECALPFDLYQTEKHKPLQIQLAYAHLSNQKV